MNLHGLVSGVISAVNPPLPLTIEVSTGSTTGTDGARVPTYAAPITIPGQVQALTFGDLRQLDGLNIQGVRRAIYLNGRVDGLVRVEEKGGDIIRMPAPDCRVWKVVHVLEYWPDWCKVAVTLQDDRA